MKIKILVATMALFLSQVITAQMSAEEAAQFEDDLVEKEMTTLTDEQKEQLSVLNLKYAKQRSELLAQEGSMFSKIGDMKKIGKAKEAEMAEFLTEEQLEVYKDKVAPALRKKMRKSMKS